MHIQTLKSGEMATNQKEFNKRAPIELCSQKKLAVLSSLKVSESPEENIYTQLRRLDPVSKYTEVAIRDRESCSKEHQVPKLTPKPAKRELAVQPKVNTSGESVYAQLNTLREAESQYQTLCMPAREAIVSDDVDKSKLAETSFPNVVETGKVNQADTSGKPEQACDLSNYENHEFKAAKEELHERDFNRHCCLVYWKAILGIGTITLAPIVIVLVLLFIATLGLVHANSNTESYQKLQHMTVKMDKDIAALERQLNNSVATSSTTLTEQLLILQTQLNTSFLSLQTQLNHSVQVSRAQDDILVLFDQRLQLMEQNLTSLRHQHEAEFSDVSSRITMIGNRIEQMDTSLMTLMDANANIQSTVNSLSSEVDILRTTNNNLNNEMNKLSLKNMALNSSLLHLTALSVPIGCSSNTYTRVVANGTSASTSTLRIVSKHHSSDLYKSIHSYMNIHTI